MSTDNLHLGIDVGSVSINLVVIDADGKVLSEEYLRHQGQPMAVAAEAIQRAIEKYGPERIGGLAATGSGGRVVADVLEGAFVNEVIAQAAATSRLYPWVQTIIEIGGEDSKLIFVDPQRAESSNSVADFAMNAACAAGTGSFLDEQAVRLGLDIEEFGQLALKSQNPPRVAGRCSVFAKTDMIHLQQKATPEHDIIAGLCFALARNFKSTVGSGADVALPLSFQGGLAANPGMVRAIREVFEADDEQLIIPEHFAAMGAIGAVYTARDTGAIGPPNLDNLGELARHVISPQSEKQIPPLRLEKSSVVSSQLVSPEQTGGEKIPTYLGVDVGSISTCLAVTDSEGYLLAKEYLMTAGRPLDAVQEGLRRIGETVGDMVEIRGACTTGSGRYLTADFIGADVVKNEITAHARGALHVDPQVDTIFEIGGQDSKYISLDSGVVVDFAMNNVCAAGTGSFLEEQADNLNISIKDEFAELAFQSQRPLDLGERCTVFMGTQVVRNAQAGASTQDIVAGLAYSIVYNYLNRVVGRRRIGHRIFFQGGTALNTAVVAAFESVLGQPITVPADNEVLGAIGCALLAQDLDKGEGSSFKGFELTERTYTLESFVCHDCPNECEMNKVTVEGEEPLFYGSRCGKYDVRKTAQQTTDLPDLFAEREEMLLNSYRPSQELPDDAVRVGLPRALEFHDLFPLWQAFLTELGCQVVLSGRTNRQIIHEGAEHSVVETCFPMKLMLGHVLDVLQRDIDYILLPSVINLPKKDPGMTDSFLCPYSQSHPYTLQATVDFEGCNVRVLQPEIYLTLGRKHLIERLYESIGKVLGKTKREVARAVDAGLAALERFEHGLRKRGREVLRQLAPDQTAIVIVSRSYNGCDLGANLHIPTKLLERGALPIPMDFLPLEDVRLPADWFNMFWGYGQKILSAAEVIANDDRLHALYLTNFGCGPDSFLLRFFTERLGTEPCLIIEVDEHSADAGIITRLEAFLDSLEATRSRSFAGGRHFRPLSIEPNTDRTILIPNMSSHAYALAAAIESCGVKAQVLDEPDEETLYWGRKYTSGKECFPCIVTTGDMIKYTQRDDFDRDKYAFFMGGSGGPCRFGQYNTLQRMALDDAGYPDVPIYAPNQAGGFFGDLGVIGRGLLRRAWRGIVAMDVIEKALCETRPYETEPGVALRTHNESFEDIFEAIRTNSDLNAALARSLRRFQRVPVDRSEQRSIIGLVGEFYVRVNRFSNQHLIEQIERLGGEVWMSPIYEWFLYRNFRRGMRARLDRRWRLWLKNLLVDRVMVNDEHSLVASFDGFVRNIHEPSTELVLGYAAEYIRPSFEGEAVMTIGKAVDFAKKDLSGLVAVMPFTCMPGTISQAIIKRMRADYDNIPFLNMVYDGDEQATAQTRLEAFMYQTREYSRQRPPQSQSGMAGQGYSPVEAGGLTARG